MGWLSVISADLLVDGIAFGLLLFSAALWCVHVMAICYGYNVYHRRKARLVAARNAEQAAPGVSIIKPLCGMDANLLSNLETFFTLQYKTYELLFCVHTENDPALKDVYSLISKYPNVNTTVFIGGEDVGINPKINNMMPAYRAAAYGFVLISDAGIKMKSDTVNDMVEMMTDRVALVTQMPFSCDRTGFAATLEKIFFGTMHARMYLSADLWGIVCSTGMSSLLRKAALDGIGGMESFGKYLAEDYFFAKTLHSKGWKSALAAEPAWQNSAMPDVAKFQDRLCRWCKLRQAMLPHIIILEPLQDCVLLGILSSWAANLLLGWNSLVYFLVHVLVWMLLDYVLLSVIQRGSLPFGKFEYVVSWAYRECMALPIFIRALLQPSIQWRTGGPYRLRWGGLVRQDTTDPMDGYKWEKHGAGGSMLCRRRSRPSYPVAVPPMGLVGQDKAEAEMDLVLQTQTRPPSYEQCQLQQIDTNNAVYEQTRSNTASTLDRPLRHSSNMPVTDYIQVGGTR